MLSNYQAVIAQVWTALTLFYTMEFLLNLEHKKGKSADKSVRPFQLLPSSSTFDCSNFIPNSQKDALTTRDIVGFLK